MNLSARSAVALPKIPGQQRNAPLRQRESESVVAGPDRQLLRYHHIFLAKVVLRKRVRRRQHRQHGLIAAPHAGEDDVELLVRRFGCRGCGVAFGRVVDCSFPDVPALVLVQPRGPEARVVLFRVVYGQDGGEARVGEELDDVVGRRADGRRGVGVEGDEVGLWLSAYLDSSSRLPSLTFHW